ncbi:hypothetical protein C942_04590 [Photobacterium marinum]|uniref:Uncharacterized protein n=1 Tax=Photobacterium marinum TaxID=1056511 RepID=L8JDG4_9GAMM|nr:hypothetical protein [Photobacterium marinum]ELR66891.1 hypothetical protein C942_04590 [Photobacterium marinum]
MSVQQILTARLNISSILSTTITAIVLTGCSSFSDSDYNMHTYRFHDSAKGFISLNDTRINGAIVDKGLFYPKSAFSFTYRYCAKNTQSAAADIEEFDLLAKRVCDANHGQLIHQQTGTWCVDDANTVQEYPLFYAKISRTELWADLCLDGPFVTLKVIENTEASRDQWFEAAQILGYQPYSSNRRLVVPDSTHGHLYDAPKEPVATEFWNEESEYIYTQIGAVVCLYNRPEDTNIGYTYRGTVHSVGNGMVKVAATTKLRGDIRTAPVLEEIEWHRLAYITAAANSWFVCG